MPVVALRKPATELPLSFVLTDREAMAPGTRLDQFESLVVTAKISKTGNASESGQGLEVWSDPVSPLDGKEINLIITAASKAGGESNE
jgi:cytochrome c-type biogenesis protein CcmH